MMNQLIRIIAIILLGMLLYLNTYEKDELGLTAFFAYVGLLGFTFIIGIPIIFLYNKVSLGKKIGLVILSMAIAAIIPALGFGNLKYALEDYLAIKEIEKVENEYKVELQIDNVFLTFDQYLLVGNKDDLVGNMDKTLVVYDTSGKAIKSILVTELAKATVPHLPFTEKEKETTYFDGMDTQGNAYDLVKKINSNHIQLTFRYVTTEVPEGYKPDPDMPSDAKDTKFHYKLTYSPVIDENGEFKFSSDTFQVYTDNESIRVSYIAEGMEAIVAPSSAVLVSEIN